MPEGDPLRAVGESGAPDFISAHPLQWMAPGGSQQLSDISKELFLSPAPQASAGAGLLQVLHG